MFSSFASVLLLGIVAPPQQQSLPKPLPGIELLNVARPTHLHGKIILSPISASGMLLVDASSGEELASVNPDERRPMASLTKIMTALLVLEHHELTDTVTIPPVAENVGGSAVGLIPGQHMTVGALLRTLLLPSANDAAYALASYQGPGVATFVKSMNERAEALGLKNTHFANPAGLDHPEQYSSARDLAWLTLAALKDKRFASIVQTRSARVESSEGQRYDLRNTNEMLHYNEDVYGVKTGTTDAAGECLIVLFKQDDRPYLLVLLGSKDRYTDSLHILSAIRAAQ
jgi:D-alanyl-D-alanine carboxypeptidase